MFNKIGRKPAAIRSDNGREYISKELEDFLRREGVEHQYTVPYSREQNGVAERKNRTLVEAAKSMLLDAGLDKRFWAEAVLTAAYLQNRMVSRSIDKTPLKLFTGQRPDLSHVRAFGAKVYSHIPKEKRRKLDDKAQEGVLVGYHGGTAGYRILDPATDEIWISRSVKVIESEHTNQKGCQEEKEVQAQPPTRTLEYGSCEDPTQDKESSGDENVDEEFQTPPVTPVEIQARVSKRNNKGVLPLRLGYKVRVFSVREPRSWDHMLQMTPRERMPWLAAAEEEIRSLREHQVWEMADLPPDRKVVSCKWVFKGKTDGDGQVHTY